MIAETLPQTAVQPKGPRATSHIVRDSLADAHSPPMVVYESPKFFGFECSRGAIKFQTPFGWDVPNPAIVLAVFLPLCE